MTAPTTVTAVPARRRLVLWVAAGTGCVLAALVTAFAFVGPPPDTTQLLGRPAPAVAGSNLGGGGRPVSLRNYAGRWVLVDFAASWCVPCQQELPKLQAFARSAARYHAALITVAESPSDGPALARYMSAHGAHWPAVQDPQAVVSYGVTGIPTVFLVDPDGIIVGYYPSGVSPSGLDSFIRTAGASGVS